MPDLQLLVDGVIWLGDVGSAVLAALWLAADWVARLGLATALVIASGRNCITWAVPRWLCEGGYLMVRRSHFGTYPFRYRLVKRLAGYVPHVVWQRPDGRIFHYTVTDAQHQAYWDKGLLAALLSAVHFEGVVIEGDVLNESTGS